MAKAQADRIVHKAAWLYYTHGLRQDEVAQRLNISRASVALYLRRARESGIVTISTATHLFRGEQLARQVEDALGLEAAWIVGDAGGAADEEAEIPPLAASVFLELVGRGQRIGIAWGRTVYAIADVMSFADLEGVTVVQLCGNLGAPYSYRPDQCTMEIARRLNARGLNFYAPLVLSTVDLAGALREEPVIREQLDSVAGCDLSLYSVGTLDEDSHVVRCGALTVPELGRLKAQGAVGVVAGQIIDRAGRLLQCDYNRRVISADLASLKAIPRRLMVVQEAVKLEPLRAALAGGFCTHLVTTSTIARQLLPSP
jgi:DNA-binding transcriptional regulator LsrR (DeoR family)